MFSSSPRLIAAYHVFLRLPTPRHPPDALVNLFLEELPSIPYSIVKEPPLRAAMINMVRKHNIVAAAAVFHGAGCWCMPAARWCKALFLAPV